jgi:hypothetical protein
VTADPRQWGSRKVEPPRKRRSEKAQRARAARRLAQQLEATAGDRQQAWTEGDEPFLTERLSTDLDHLHADKRTMRRDIYREAPELEGRPVHRNPPKRLAG